MDVLGYRDSGSLAATFSWTTDYDDPWCVDKLLGEAGVNGIIAAQSIGAIRNWVSGHGATHRMATAGDRLFR